MLESSSNENTKHTKEAIEDITNIIVYKWGMPKSSANALVEEIITQYLKEQNMESNWLGESELARFKSVGKNVLVSNKASLIGIEKISIGNDVRIDDFCTLNAANGFIEIGSNVHIGGYCYLGGGGGIIMEDFSGISQGVRVYSASDDYSGKYMTNPTVPAEFTGVQSGTVTLEKHAIVGSNSVILPRVKIKEGTAIGAMSLIKKSCRPWSVYVGSPAQRIGPRDKGLLELEKMYKQ